VRGRADDVINTGGHKVVPGEVAAALESCPGVRDVAVVGQPDPEWGERVVAVVAPADPADPPGLELLRLHVCERLPRYAAPSRVVMVDAVPMLSSGKHDIVRLRQELLRREQTEAEERYLIVPGQCLPLRIPRGGEGYLVEAQLNDVSNACVVTRRREVPHAADRYR